MRMMLRNVSSWRAVHVRMSANGAAHGLAKLTTRNVIDRIWTSSIPNCICDIVLQDQIGSM
jgi:hypothetical protein